jgi:hypothetical protein
MVSCRNGIIAAVALIGLATVDAASEATANIDSTDAAYCHWYLQKARVTGDEYWRDRWLRCLRGDDWETPRRNFGAPRR